MKFFNRKYKDSVFSDLFGSDINGKRNFLELYNALSGSDYVYEDTEIERKVIDQTLYRTFNNDVSMLIDGKLIVLVEHQSTINENMPLRCLEYVTRIYEGIVPPDRRYDERVYKIPTPDFYVIYNGKKKYSHEKTLRLSDAFYNGGNPKLELTINVKNCTDSSELPVRKNCAILKEYCIFVETVERQLAVYKKSQKAFRKAIDECIKKGILSDYLKRKSREVINMLCAKYSYKTDMRVKYEMGYDAGKAEGKSEGRKENALEAAKKFLIMNILSHEQIAMGTGLSVEEVDKLADELKTETE
ncbi:Rpn family recombination-promoting nuclease/putative transposase [Treponema sp.]|uniref:Rpn family recombination-promoting nuclease/putative transposase n=1 Tax=Treponema sp. TaxID=166 RepID=UPI00298E2691|nr:Rpn family recombination-promoting nuclease/putative transposase [Treponema sp.]MCQ2242294.1 Rpn family recombination-promoting nuclease/putative transposase [Treponema sp.]